MASAISSSSEKRYAALYKKQVVPDAMPFLRRRTEEHQDTKILKIVSFKRLLRALRVRGYLFTVRLWQTSGL
jgi:hypothetical protein